MSNRESDLAIQRQPVEAKQPVRLNGCVTIQGRVHEASEVLWMPAALARSLIAAGRATAVSPTKFPEGAAHIASVD
jgi:hypothetical protein